MTDIVRAVAEDEAHIGLAYNPQPDPRISFVASAPAPTKLLVRKNHPLTLIKKPLSLQQVLQYPLALMAAGYGVSQVIETLEYAEHIKFNPLLRSNSIVALKRFVRSTDGVTFFFTGAAAAPELAAGQVAPLDIAHPLCAAAKLRLIVRQSRPLSPAATRMLMEIRRNIPGFGTGGAPSEKSKGNPRGREQGYRQRRLGADHAIAATAERTLPVMTWDRGKYSPIISA
jgi:DNA-binding transcriptional LysR family regulator